MDAANNENKPGDSAPAAGPGQMNLKIRTARVQKLITVDENISIQNVSLSSNGFAARR